MRPFAFSFVFLSLALFATAAPHRRSCVKRNPRPISVASATELGPIKQQQSVKARDNGQSAVFTDKDGNNVSLWFFDDTLTDSSFIPNTSAQTKNLDASNNIDLSSSDWTRTTSADKPGLFIPFTEEELAFQAAHDKATTGCTGDSDPFCGAQFAHWPGPVFADPERGRIVVAYGKLCRGSEGSRCASTALAGEMIGWGFFFVVPELGLGDRLKPNTGGAMDVTGSNDPALFGGAQDFSFSGGALAHDGFAYLYGSANMLEGSKVARVPLASFEDKSQWVYWDGSAWQSDVNAGKGIMGPGAAGNTVFFSEPLNGFYNVYCPFGTNEVFMQSAPAPEGPWSDPVSLFISTPVNNATNYACYAHPEFASADGLTQYISFFRTGDGAQVLTKVQLQ